MSNPVYKKEITITQVARSVAREGKFYWRLPCSDSSGITDSSSIDNIEPTSDSEYLFVSNEDSSYSKFKIDKDVLDSEYTLQADKLPTPIVTIPDTIGVGAKLTLQVSNVRAVADYVWEASAGQFNITTGTEVEYTAPTEDTPCMVKLSCYAKPRQGAEIYSNSDKLEKYVYIFDNSSTGITVKPETDIEDFTLKSGETKVITVTNKGDYTVLASTNNGTIQVANDKVTYTGGKVGVNTKVYIFFKSSNGYSTPETFKIITVGVQPNAISTPQLNFQTLAPLYSEEEVTLPFDRVDDMDYMVSVNNGAIGYVKDKLIKLKSAKVSSDSEINLELRAIDVRAGLISDPATLTVAVKSGVRSDPKPEQPTHTCNSGETITLSNGIGNNYSSDKVRVTLEPNQGQAKLQNKNLVYVAPTVEEQTDVYAKIEILDEGSSVISEINFLIRVMGKKTVEATAEPTTISVESSAGAQTIQVTTEGTKVVAKSTNTDVATVQVSGKTVTVTPVTTGEANIEITVSKSGLNNKVITVPVTIS
ncbi:TPA: hypothetical protein SFZ43_000100 [Campylobacter jejuni]|nr:hypothetical protein [Campylobacter jejuni]